MNQAPIFVHSLFRSGSTYFFNVFRCSERGFWCYQEPLHEAVIGANEEPNKLLDDSEDKLVEDLRHPSLNANYYHELVQIWPAWKNCLEEKAVYDGYFAPPDQDVGVKYLQALVQAAKGVPMFQECRTAGRIARIKTEIGGIHIYLWRNPWDQWWSYKVSRYFDVANLLIINAPNAPLPVRHLRHAMNIEECIHDSIAEGFTYYWNKPSTAAESYLIFYLLWCLGLHEGIKSADLMLSIDRLSDSADYQSVVQTRLKGAGIEGLDFSDCRIPQGRYLEQEQAFFRTLEDKVHQWLLDGGWTQSDIDQIHMLRQKNQPACWNTPIENLAPADLLEQAVRARELAKRFETTQAEIIRSHTNKLSEVEAKVEQAEARATQVEARATQAEFREAEAWEQVKQAIALVHQTQSQGQAQMLALQAQSRADKLEVDLADLKAQLLQTHQELSDLHQFNHYHWQLAKAQQAQIQAIFCSKSWRITAPLRNLRQVAIWLHNKTTIPNLPNVKPYRFRRIVLSVLNWGVSYARKAPRFRRITLIILNRMPGFAIKLRQMHIESHFAQHPHKGDLFDSPAAMGMDQVATHSGKDTNHLPSISVFDGMNARQCTPLEVHFHAYGGRE